MAHPLKGGYPVYKRLKVQNIFKLWLCLMKVNFDALLIAKIFLINTSISILYQVSNTDHIEAQRLKAQNHAVQSSSSNTRQKHFSLTWQYSEGTELAELLAEHQERQLRSIQGLNVGVQQDQMNSMYRQIQIPTDLILDIWSKCH